MVKKISFIFIILLFVTNGLNAQSQKGQRKGMLFGLDFGINKCSISNETHIINSSSSSGRNNIVGPAISYRLGYAPSNKSLILICLTNSGFDNEINGYGRTFIHEFSYFQYCRYLSENERSQYISVGIGFADKHFYQC